MRQLILNLLKFIFSPFDFFSVKLQSALFHAKVCVKSLCIITVKGNNDALSPLSVQIKKIKIFTLSGNF